MPAQLLHTFFGVDCAQAGPPPPRGRRFLVGGSLRAGGLCFRSVRDNPNPFLGGGMMMRRGSFPFAAGALLAVAALLGSVGVAEAQRGGRGGGGRGGYG